MKETLSNRQIMFILTITVLPHDAMEIGKTVGEVTGTGGWITILLGVGISLLLVYMLTYVAYVFSEKTLKEYSNVVFGGFLSYIIIGSYVVYFFLISAMLPRISCSFIQLNLLEKTPVGAMTLLLFLVAYYTVCKGLRVIGRLFEIYGVVILTIAAFIHIIMLTQGKLINIRPFWGEVNSLEYIKSVTKVIPYVGIELLLIIPLEKNNPKIFKYTSIAMAIAGIVFFLVFESCVAMLGIDDIVQYKDPLFVAVRRLDVEYLEFLRRFDGIFLIAWLMAVFCKCCIYIYATTHLLNKFFKKIKFEFLSFTIVVLAYITSQLPSSFESAQEIFHFINFLSVFNVIIVPSLLFAIVKVKKYDKKMY